MAKLKSRTIKDRGVNPMTNEKNAPKNPMTEKNNGLSSAQEVTYQDAFKKANQIMKDKKNKSSNETT